MNTDLFKKYREDFFRILDEKKESEIKTSLKELLDRGLLVFEETTPQVTLEETNECYKINTTVGFRLVLRNMEYLREIENKVERLQRENEEWKNHKCVI